MTDNIDLNKTLIRNNPNISGSKLYEKSKHSGIGIRKTDFYTLLREVRNLPEPSIQKKEKATPIKYRKKGTGSKKPPKLPFEQTKFGKIVKKLEKAHGISEKRAIERARALLKIPKKDYRKLNRKDTQILLHETP
jgi:hypothetical protein